MSLPPPLPATILVAEDEPLLREFVLTVLRGAGYRVLIADDGHEALKIWAGEKDSIDLLLTDINMPRGMSGIDLAHLLLADRPNLKIIYTSGYSTELVDSDLSEENGRWFLSKPYPTSRLSQLVAQALQQKKE